MTETERDLGGGRDSLPCIVCRTPMRRVIDGGWELQPDEGLHFSAEGAYGTTAFDPMDLSTLNIIICDTCIKKAAADGLVLLGQPRVTVVDQDGVAVGFTHPEREEVPWDPERTYPTEVSVRVSDEEIVEGTITPYAMVRASAIKRARERLAAEASGE